MTDLKSAFEAVADWCELHLEAQRGREIGLLFGSALRAYGRLATLPIQLTPIARSDQEHQLNAKAEEFLLALSARFIVDYESTRSLIVEPTMLRTNMTYDPWSPPRTE